MSQPKLSTMPKGPSRSGFAEFVAQLSGANFGGLHGFHK
jgi:hypothetical protein